ncbi:MAG: XRE family transcriptional regulator [Pseudobdellovibrionaceae bacterium]
MKDAVYYSIQHHPLALSEKEVLRFLEQARFDPRLMEIMTEYLRDFWWTLSPEELNNSARKMKSPFILKVLTSVILDKCSMTKEERSDFGQWVWQATRGIKDPPPQFLYIGQFPVASKTAYLQIEEALPSFFKHNLIAKDLPFNKGIPGSLKTEKNPPANRVDELDLLKFQLGKKIKRIKAERKLSNQEMSKLTGINTVFLSKILNNKLQNISVEYLRDHLRNAILN